MIKVAFCCHGTTSVSDFPVGCQLGKSVQIVALWQVPYYGFTTVQPMKTIYVQSPFPGVVEGTMQHCRCLFWKKTVLVLFRYFGECCSDIIDIIPLKWYTISQIGGIVYVYDSKTGF